MSTTRTILICSGKGGVGKTTTTANLGIALARSGASTVVLDADFDDVTGLELALQDFLRQRVLDLLLDRALERSRAVYRVKPCLGELVARAASDR